jgi:aminoglycoside/choline kinase family phosphotransferase
MVDRTTQLNHWVKSVLSKTASAEISLTPISGDASFRHYYRVHIGDSSFVGVDAPAEQENNQQFVALAKLLGDSDLNVPRVHHVDFEHGFMLLSDMGDDLYYAVLVSDKSAAKTADRLYRSAVECLVKIQMIDHRSCTIPVFDADFILRELALFSEWFIDGQLALDPYPDFQSVQRLLVDNALEQPQVLMHRDFHSRNLLVTRHNSPGILDFQDAVIGPVAYDLASLLKDCYLRWPDEQISTWVRAYINHAEAAGVLSNTDLNQFLRWFDLIALQRHIKCAGIFSRLFLRDSKPIYLQDIPRVIGYIMTATGKYTELMPFNRWLTKEVLPRMSETAHMFEPDSGGTKT